MSTDFVYPKSWSDSFAFWWKGGTVAGSEDRLLQRGLQDIPLTRQTPDQQSPADATTSVTASKGETRSATLRHVQLSGHRDRYLNVLEIGSGPRRPEEHNLVVLHGYGGGLGYFFQNLRAMSSVPNTRLYVIDWLGMGRSGRPPFPKIKPKGKGAAAIRSRVNQAEDFFVDSLEEWREKEGISKMTLMGHSLGGYFSAAFALKHPERVNKLVLLSPVGVPEAPYELASATSDMEADAIVEAELKSQMEATTSPAAKEKAPHSWWARLWEANISPFSLIRLSTFAGPKFVSRYAAYRYAAFPNDVQKDLFEYLYLICRERGSGEYALAHILAPGAYARWPLMNRLLPTNLPITFIYGGSHDWMKPQAGHNFVAELRKKIRTPANELQRKRSRVLMNPHSGHWLYLENPGDFDRLIKREIEEAVADHPTVS